MSTVLNRNSGKKGNSTPSVSRERPAGNRDEHVVDLAIDLIDAHPDNPRENWDEQDLKSMMRSVQQAGIIQPLVVRQVGERYQLIAGERRLRAAEMAKHSTVPAVVRDISDGQARAIMMHENVERKALNPIEKAKLLSKVCSPIDDGGDGLTPEQAAKSFGRQRVWAVNLIRLLRLPEMWQKRVISGELPERQARRLVVHAESPEVLAAVERDMEVNPSYWKSDEDFERSLGVIVANPSVTGTPQSSAAKPKAPRAPAATGHSIDEMTTSAALRKDDSSFEDATAEICEAIARLSELAQLDSIQAAVDDRRAELEAQDRSNPRGRSKSRAS